MREGRLPAPALGPKQEGELLVPLQGPKPGKESFLNVHYVLKTDTLWAKQGHAVAWEQIALQPGPEAPSAALASLPAVDLQESTEAFTISGPGFSVAIGRASGALEARGKVTPDGRGDAGVARVWYSSPMGTLADEKRVRVQTLLPGQCTKVEIRAFRRLVLLGGEVASAGLEGLVRQARRLVFLYEGHDLAGVAGLKRPRSQYRQRVFQRAGVTLAGGTYPLELGWVYVAEPFRRKGYSYRLVEAAMSGVNPGEVFATSETNNSAIHKALERRGLRRAGKDYTSSRGKRRITLFLGQVDHQSQRTTLASDASPPNTVDHAIAVDLRTRRLALRPFSMADEAVFFDIERNRKIRPQIDGTPHKEESRRRLQNAVKDAANGDYCLLAITLAQTSKVIGLGGVLKYDPTDDLQVLIAILPRWWGNRFGPEAARALLRWAFQDRRHRRVLGVVKDGNKESLRMIRKLRARRLRETPLLASTPPDHLFEFRPPTKRGRTGALKSAGRSGRTDQ